jgi:hypothetical protein
MGIRLAVITSLSCCLAAIAVPAGAGAHVSVGTGVTANAFPNPSVSGDPIVIYGQITTRAAGRPIRLYRSIQPRSKSAGSPRYELFQQTTVQPTGWFEFSVPAGTVLSNWHLKVIASKLLKSRTIPELVIPVLTLSTRTASAESGESVVLSGKLFPSHPHEAIILQYQVGAGGFKWRKLSIAALDRRSRFTVRHRFSAPGTYDIRALFIRDRENFSSVSDIVTIVVQQPPVPGFSASTTTPIVDPKASATISGVLDSPESTAIPSPLTGVQLWGRTHGSRFVKLAQTTTDATGQYSFSVTPAQTETYQVRVAAGPPRHSADVVIGVRQLVSIATRSRTTEVGRKIAFTGHVSPSAAGHSIVLQRLESDGAWVTVQFGRVRRGSSYRILRTINVPGKEIFRVVVPGGPTVVSGSSRTRTVRATMRAVQSLPRPT